MSIDFIDLYLTKLNFLFSIYFFIHTSNITIQFDEDFQLLQRHDDDNHEKSNK